MEATAKVDSMNRIILPPGILKSLRVNPGDVVFMKYDPEDHQLLVTPVSSQFDLKPNNRSERYRRKRAKIA